MIYLIEETLELGYSAQTTHKAIGTSNAFIIAKHKNNDFPVFGLENDDFEEMDTIHHIRGLEVGD